DLFNRGQPALEEVTMAKLYTTELSQDVLYDCMQVHGGLGYLTECPIGRHWRDVRLKTIGGGSSEIMKEILAEGEGIGQGCKVRKGIIMVMAKMHAHSN